MYVIKRDGRKEKVKFDEITARIDALCYDLDTDFVDSGGIAQKVINGVYPGVSTIELDTLASETAAYLTCTHPDYARLAARLAISNLYKETPDTFSEAVSQLGAYRNPKTDSKTSLLSRKFQEFVASNASALDTMIVTERDFDYSYFGFKTLERSYLLRAGDKIIERPQYMLLRVATAIHLGNLEKIQETYDLLSQKWFTHASPTLFNAGAPYQQMSSCFLLQVRDDSIEGIYDTLKDCASISKNSGGIGVAFHKIRASSSYIAGTNGTSNGLVPMLRVYNSTARFVNQGGGKRNGSIACYLEPWHPDIFAFLDLRKNTGKEEARARDLFLALWVPDLFMSRVERNENWSLFCPNEASGLHEVWGDEFEALYTKYEREGLARSVIPAQKLWFAILEAQTETGTPYMLYKDACNRKSNQKHLGTIQGSNLCTEILEYTAPDEVAVCNLASIALPKFVRVDGSFDFEKLFEITKVVTVNLNKVIDLNYYPVEAARKSNMRHRPIGIGVQGLADAFIKMRLPFDCEEARQLNKDIFETIYFASITSSMEMARRDCPYETFAGSPMSRGIFQQDMWGVSPSGRWDWETLRANVMKYGVVNSLLLAPMPTASTAQILGNNESFEPYTSNIYSRRVLSGEFQVVNEHLLLDLAELGLWDDRMKNKIIDANGSVQTITEIPSDIKSLYRTVWEISQKALIDMAADRGAFIDQSQSFNVHIAVPNYGKLTSMHFYAWHKGLKTGMYYLRSRPAASAIQFTVDKASIAEDAAKETAKETIAKAAAIACSIENRDDCLMCGS